MTVTKDSTDRATMDRVIEEHFRHEAAGNVQGALTTFTDDVEHDVVGDPAGVLYGPDAVGERYTHLFESTQVQGVEPLRRLYGEDFVVDDKIWKAKVVGDFLGIDGRDRIITMRVMHVFEFRNGLISRENVWLDAGAAIAQLMAE